MRIRVNINVKVGKIIKYFILVDLVFFAGWGFIEPIFSVFIVEKIVGATLVTAGITAAIYWLLKSTLQVPLANYLDRHDGEKDDFYALILGLLLAGVSAFLFGFAKEIWQIYSVQALHAVGIALYVASYPAIFSRHLDKDHVSFDWAMDSAAVGVSSGMTALVGGIIASQFGFASVFALTGIFSVAAAFILIMAPDLLLPHPRKTAKISPLAKDKPSAADGL